MKEIYKRSAVAAIAFVVLASVPGHVAEESSANGRLSRRRIWVQVSGPPFKNNIVDSVYVFRKEGGKWQLWQQVVLETKFIE